MATLNTDANANWQSTTIHALRACIEARIPVVTVGEPGVGKTAEIRALAKSMDYKLITLLGSQMDPTDITGLPKGEVIYQNDEGEDVWGTVYLAPWWQVQIMRHRRVIVFLDEWSNTSAEVRASFLTFLQNREFPNGEALPPETIVIGAMNPTSQAADGWELDKPTTNRIVFLQWKSPRDKWFAGMLNAWGEDNVSEEEFYWRKMIVRFLKDNPTYLQRMNDAETGTPEAHDVDINDESALEILRYAWSSRRSWNTLAKVLTYLDRKDYATQDEIASGTVGRASAIAFRSWILENDVVDPKSVLKDPHAYDWASADVSEANIIFRAVVEMIDAKTWRNSIELLDAVANADRQALIGAYISDIFREIVLAAKKVSTAELDEARKQIKVVLKKYSNKDAVTAKVAS